MSSKIASAKPVVTRFAPSPTGYLHIGGARTALFNWLYARHTGGKFLLRIEDTDRQRHTPEAVEAILDGLKWLGLDWDGEPLSQFSRVARHAEVAHELLAAGKAYRCYLSQDELAAMREKAEAEKKSFTVMSPWRDRDPKDAPAGVPGVVRFKAPRDGETVVDDLVQGRVVFQNKELDDLVILRSDGTPIYNLAVVVDDHDMGVTHVVRGVDHLTNAARQSQIYQAMGWDVPVFGHVPLIHGADGAKLSKRHGALGIEAYRGMGYLPSALKNYLVRLGWSHGDDEIFPLEKMIEWFDLTSLGKSAARMDFKKLADTNAHYIRETPDANLLAAIEAVLPEMGSTIAPVKLNQSQRTQMLALIPDLKPRAQTLREVIDGAAAIFAVRPLALDDKAAKLLDAEAKDHVKALASQFVALPAWEAKALEDAVRLYAESAGAKLGKIAQPLRAALTGTSVSPPVFKVMEVLGRDETLARLGDQATTGS
ncbi:MAG: glutamate--tRNA ligase [Hyphomicrobiaceae bacterium]